MIFQAGISSEALFYFNLLKDISLEENKEETRGKILSEAIENSKLILNWKEIIDDNSISLKNMNYSSKRNMLKVDIKESDVEFIQNLKFQLPIYTNKRSMTIGKTIMYILKASLIVNQNREKFNKIENEQEEINKILNSFKLKMQEIVSPLHLELLDNILDNLENDLKDIN